MAAVGWSGSSVGTTDAGRSAIASISRSDRAYQLDDRAQRMRDKGRLTNFANVLATTLAKVACWIGPLEPQLTLCIHSPRNIDPSRDMR